MDNQTPMTLRSSLAVGKLSFRLYLDEGLIKAIRMGFMAFWLSFMGDYEVHEIDD